ncbi:MAG TPA: hypothetical protein PKA77_04240 [Chitinophagaceae bacterium]|jgi:hypothetical protein|nr:hypothetical protein [Chitinophagaceae bacterium]HMU57955.1 hypothetical protein [Chitinophagaceae bacterium]
MSSQSNVNKKGLLAGFLFCSIALFPCKQGITQAVDPATVLTYLKQNIHVYYINSPNTISAINTISPEFVEVAVDRYIFGTRSNNGMDTCARFLSSLFKNRNNGGDGHLQDWVYQLLKVKSRRINIYFVNDVNSPITTEGLLLNAIDTVRVRGQLRVMPSVWNVMDVAEAGNIMLGEFLLRQNLKLCKQTFLRLLIYAELSSYRSLHVGGVHTFKMTEYPDIDFYAGNAVMDYRYVTDEGICTGLLSSYDFDYQSGLNDWVKRPVMMLTRNIPVRASRELNLNWLPNQRPFIGLPASYVTPPNSLMSESAARRYGMVNFSLPERNSDVRKMYRYRNEMMQGLLFHFCLWVSNLRSFLGSVSYDNYRYCNAQAAQKLPLFLENFTRENIGGIPLTQLATTPPANKAYLAPMVFMHFFYTGSAPFTYAEFTNLIGGGYPEELFNLYDSNTRAAVEAIKQHNNILETGWPVIRNQLKELLTR